MYFEHLLAALSVLVALPPGSFPHPFLTSFHCLLSVMGACFPFLWGLMAGLPGFASYGRSLHVGADCQ